MFRAKAADATAKSILVVIPDNHAMLTLRVHLHRVDGGDQFLVWEDG